MISDGSYDEIKESVMEALGWSTTGLCLAVIKTLQEIDCWVYCWTNNDDPRDVLTHVDLYLSRPPEEVYAAMKNVLHQYNLEFDNWKWSAAEAYDPTKKNKIIEPIPKHAPDNVCWLATLSFRSKHTNWTENDPPPGGERIPNGWRYEPNPPTVGLNLHTISRLVNQIHARNERLPT